MKRFFCAVLTAATTALWCVGNAQAQNITIELQSDAFVRFSNAVESGSVSTVREMLEAGFDPNTTVKSGDVALVRSIRLEHDKLTQLLLNAKDIDVNAESDTGETALMLAVFKQSMPLVDRLLKMKAQVNKAGWTPLHYAATVGSVELINKLIALGANVNAMTADGITPLYMAARMPSYSAVTTLLKAGAYRNICTRTGASPASAAKAADNERLAQYLAFDKCASPKAIEQLNARIQIRKPSTAVPSAQ